MICPSCEQSIPPGSRYCVHCGAEQAVPTPIAAVAAAGIGRGVRREAANAAHAEPAPAARHAPEERVAHLPEARLALATGSDASAPAPASPPAYASAPAYANAPAYASAPARHGVATGLVVVALAIGALGAAAWWTQLRPHGEPAPAPATTAAPTPAPANVPAPASTAAEVDAAPPVPQAKSAADTLHSAEARVLAPPASVGEPASSAPSVEITALPPHRATRPAPRANAAGEAKPKPPEPAQPPAPPPVQHAAAAPVAPVRVPVGDRWSRMEEELSACTREDFIARVVCGQRVRFRYCDGYWGKVPACPGSPAPERGQ